LSDSDDDNQQQLISTAGGRRVGPTEVSEYDRVS